MGELPITKQEMDILLAGLRDLEGYYTQDLLWTKASKIDRITTKLQVNLSRYEEVPEDLELPDRIINTCKYHALASILSEWGNLTYEQVVESLERDGDVAHAIKAYNSNEDILVWEPLEDYTALEILDFIQNNYINLLSVANLGMRYGEGKN